MATMENTEKRPVGRPAFVDEQMLAQVKEAPIGEWVEIGDFNENTTAARAKRLRGLQGNIEVKTPLMARRVRGRASKKRQVKATA